MKKRVKKGDKRKLSVSKNKLFYSKHFFIFAVAFVILFFLIAVISGFVYNNLSLDNSKVNPVVYPFTILGKVIFPTTYDSADLNRNMGALDAGSSGNDSGWYSFEKDSDNSMIADTDIAPPFKLKWMQDDSNSIAIYPVLLSQDDKLISISDSFGKYDGITKVVYNSSNGEKLWSYNGEVTNMMHGPGTILAKEYILSADSHDHEPANEIETGLTSPSMVWCMASNYDPADSFFITDGWAFGGTDQPDYTFGAFDISNYTGAQAISDGKFNRGFLFQEVPEDNSYNNLGFEYIDLGKRNSPYNQTDTDTQLNPGSNNWTVMMWFKWDGNISHTIVNNEILFRKGNIGARINYNSTTNNSDIQYSFTGFDPVTNYFMYGNNFSCAANEWCQLTLTYDHQYEKMYKDGVLVFNRSNNGDIGSNTNSFFIGGEAGDWTYSFSGIIDEFAMFNRSLSASEIASKYDSEITPDSSTAVLMHFDNDSAHGENGTLVYDSSKGENGTFVYDSSGNNNNGFSVWHYTDKNLWTAFVAGSSDRTASCDGGFSAIDDGMVFRSDGYLIADNQTNGNVIWKNGNAWNYSLIGNINFDCNKIAYSEGKVYATGMEYINGLYSSKPVLLVYNATTGAQIIKIDLNNSVDDGSSTKDFIVENNTAFVLIHGLTAINLTSGEVLWNQSLNTNYDITFQDPLGRKQFLVSSGNLIFISESGNSIKALDKQTGNEVWQFDYPNIIFTGMIIDNNALFLGGSDGRIFAFEQGYSSPQIINSETNLPTGQKGTLYQINIGTTLYPSYINYSFNVLNGEYPYNWSIISGSLPDGLVFQNDPDNQNGILVGTPTESGDFNFIVQVTDAQNNSAEKQFDLRILPGSMVFSMDLQNGVNNYSGCEDAGIDGYPGFGDENYGNSSFIQGHMGGITDDYAERGLMKFNIFQSEGGLVPDDAIIVGADLTFYKNDSSAVVVSVYQLLKNWSQMEVTWNNATANETWFSPGANGTGIDRTEELMNFTTEKCDNGLLPNIYCITYPSFYSSGSGFYTLDITSLLQRYNSGEENYGWMFTQPEQSAMQIASCENSNLSLRPVLTINYKRFNPDDNPPNVSLYVNPSIVLSGTNSTIYATMKSNFSILNYTSLWGYFLGSYNYPLNLSCILSNDSESLYCVGTKKMDCDGESYYHCVTYGFNTTYLYFEGEDEYGMFSNVTLPVQVIESFSSTIITTTMLRDGVVNQAYSDYVYVAGNSSTVTWNKDSGNLPSGLSLNSATGEIDGTPTASGTYNFTVGVNGVEQNLSINIMDSGESPTECTDDSNCSYLDGACATGACNNGVCDYNYNSSTDICRAASGECDIAGYCTGSSANCPADSFNSTGTICSTGFCNGQGSCVVCNTNSNCGTNNITGNLFCSSGNVFQNYTNYTCSNAGTASSSCSSSISGLLNQSCGTSYCGSFGASYCKPDRNVYQNQTCYSKGCSSGSCYSNPFVNESLAQSCTNGCYDGYCNCSSDSDCGSGHCSNGNCIQCENNSDCSKGDKCSDGFCETCTVVLANTTWTGWTNTSSCYNETISQSRNITQYDLNDCGTYINTTLYSYQNISCVSCGDGICSSDENCSTCSQDCGQCQNNNNNNNNNNNENTGGGSSGGGGGSGAVTQKTNSTNNLINSQVKINANKNPNVNLNSSQTSENKTIVNEVPVKSNYLKIIVLVSIVIGIAVVAGIIVFIRKKIKMNELKQENGNTERTGEIA